MVYLVVRVRVRVVLGSSAGNDPDIHARLGHALGVFAAPWTHGYTIPWVWMYQEGVGGCRCPSWYYSTQHDYRITYIHWDVRDVPRIRVAGRWLRISCPTSVLDLIPLLIGCTKNRRDTYPKCVILYLHWMHVPRIGGGGGGFQYAMRI